MKHAKQLLKVLQDQLETCTGYVILSRKKTDVLVTGDIQALDAIVREEQTILMKMESFDRKRDQLLADAGLRQTSISELIARHVEDDLKSLYQEVYEQLYAAIDELRKSSRLNERLIKQRLSVVNSLLPESPKGMGNHI